MTGVVMMLAVITGSVIQVQIPAPAALGQARFPVLLAVTLYYALNYRAGTAFIAGILAGLVQDVLGPMPLGYSMVCFCTAGYVAGRFRELVIPEAFTTSAFFGALGGAGVTLGLAALLLSSQSVSYGFGWIGLKVLGTALLAVLVTPIVFAVLGRIDRVVGNLQQEKTVDGFR